MLALALTLVLPPAPQHVAALEEQKLVPADTAVYDFFGYALDLEGDAAAVGAYWDDVGATASGSVYVWERAGDAWVERAELAASDGATRDELGYAVALERGPASDTIAAGAPLVDTGGTSAGAVYVFEGGGASWTRAAKLQAGDAGQAAFFGVSVALDAKTLVAGAPGADGGASRSGAAYVFVRSPSGWTQQAKLVASDGASDDDLGRGVAVDGDTVAVGAPLADPVAFTEGAVYVYVRSGTTWTEQAKLVAPDADVLDRFGESVALVGDVLAVTARRDDDLGSASGSAWVWTRSGSVWTPATKLVASDGHPDALFGSWVALAERGPGAWRLAVGARAANGAQPASGAAYVFEGAGSAWTETARLVAHDGETDDLAGGQVALSGDRVLVGAHRDDDAEPANPSAQSGSATVWRLLPPDPGGTVLCTGDGAGAACPCGNDSTTPGEGCVHSGGRGMTISAAGSASLAADDLVLVGSGCPPGHTGVFLAGLALDPPVPLTDGLRCAGGATKVYRGRWQTTGVVSDEGLVAQETGAPFLTAGATARFQYWSRDTASPCGGGANLSPVYALTMAP